MKRSIALFSLLLLFFTGNSIYSQVNDISNQTYGTIEIGRHTWMTENLNVAFYNNGDSIPRALTTEDWKRYGNAKKGCWAYYNNDSSNGKYGKLYNCYAVTDSRGLAPAGWRIPTFEDWDKLIEKLGGKQVAGKKMKSVDGWEFDTGTNESGFNAKPGGLMDYKFIRQFQTAIFWSSSAQAVSFEKKYKPVTDNLNWAYELSSSLDQILGDRNEREKLFSVRCLKK